VEICYNFFNRYAPSPRSLDDLAGISGGVFLLILLCCNPSKILRILRSLAQLRALENVQYASKKSLQQSINPKKTLNQRDGYFAWNLTSEFFILPYCQAYSHQKPPHGGVRRQCAIIFMPLRA
jgi:hypothetical protein